MSTVAIAGVHGKIALLLGALVWPGYLLGPGDPQGTADQITQALSAKDSAALDGLSCKGPNGAPVTQLSPQVLQFITKVAPAGPTTTCWPTGTCRRRTRCPTSAGTR